MENGQEMGSFAIRIWNEHITVSDEVGAEHGPVT